MEKTITRTFKLCHVTITDAMNGEVLKTETKGEKTDNKKEAMAFIKETGTTNFLVNIEETEEVREMPLSFFLEHSTIVEPKANKPESKPEAANV